MIIRVLQDGQYDVSDDVVGELNRLDRRATDALDRSDDGALEEALGEMVRAIKASGTRLPDDTLTASQIVIPPGDFTLDETRKLMSEQGLIPDPPA
jgi:hypothetical protein